METATFHLETSHQFKVRRCGPRGFCVYEIHAGGSLRYVGSSNNLPERLGAHWRKDTYRLRSEFDSWEVRVTYCASRALAGLEEERRLIGYLEGPEAETIRNRQKFSRHAARAMEMSKTETIQRPPPPAPSQNDPLLWSGSPLRILEPEEPAPPGWRVVPSTMLDGKRVAVRDRDVD